MRSAAAANHLGSVGGLVDRIAGINPLGREAEEEILASLEAVLLETGEQQLIRRAGIRGRFQIISKPGWKSLVICSWWRGIVSRRRTLQYRRREHPGRRFATVQTIGSRLLHVNSSHGQSGFGELDCQWQSDVAQTHSSRTRGFGFDLLFQ